MAHEIVAKCQWSGQIISLIFISPSNQGKAWILYESLNCSRFNRGICGSGSSAVLSEEELKICKSKFNYLIGEPSDDVSYIIETSPPYRNTRNVFEKVLRSIGSRLKKSDIKINLDKESLLDVERFLNDIQYKGDVFVEFQ